MPGLRIWLGMDYPTGGGSPPIVLQICQPVRATTLSVVSEVRP